MLEYQFFLVEYVSGKSIKPCHDPAKYVTMSLTFEWDEEKSRINFHMKRSSQRNKKPEEPEMLAEYDFSQGIRGKYYEAYRKGHTVKIHKSDGTTVMQHFTLQDGAVMLEPDVREYFPDSKSVNEALRMLIKIIPKPKRPSSKQKRAA